MDGARALRWRAAFNNNRRQLVKIGGVAVLFILLMAASAGAQTSWTGTSSTAWATAANWTAGVPTATVDAIIGDTNFTGLFQPSLSANSACKSLTIGTGTK